MALANKTTKHREVERRILESLSSNIWFYLRLANSLIFNFFLTKKLKNNGIIYSTIFMLIMKITKEIIDVLLSVKSMKELYTKLDSYNVKFRNDLFEVFSYYLFKLNSDINSGLEALWLYENIPGKVQKNLKLDQVTDKKFDMLAKIKNEYYAIRCIFRHDSYDKFEWSYVSNFFKISFGNRIKGGFLVSNTFFLCTEILSTGKIGTVNEYSLKVADSDKVHVINGDFFEKLPIDFFDKMHTMIQSDVCNTPVDVLKKLIGLR